MYFFIFTNYIFFYGNFQKKKFLNKELKKNPYTIRIIGSNIV